MRYFYIFLSLLMGLNGQTVRENLQRVPGTNTISGAQAQFPFQVQYLANLKLVPVASANNGQVVAMTGNTVAGDAGAGQFVYSFASTATPDDDLIVLPAGSIGRWLRISYFGLASGSPDAGTLTGTTLASNVIHSSLQDVAIGTLGSMATQNVGAVSIIGGTINGVTITGLPAGTNPGDAVNLLQLQGVSSGIVLRDGVDLATTVNITLSGEQMVDGEMTNASRVLVKNQSAPAENGILISGAGAWTRATDSDTAGELLVGYTYFVSSGDDNTGSSWSINVAPTTLNTDPVVFAQFGASQSYFAGTGLDLIGNTFSLKAAQSGLTITASAFAGAFNGTVGATTPSTGAFTSVTTTGNITSAGSITANNSAFISSNGAAATTRAFGAFTADLLRWYWGANNTAESGANTGSNFFIGSANDAGSFLAVWQSINRATGSTVFPGGINSTTIGATTPAAGAFTTGTVNLLTRTGTSTTPSVWGVVSDSTTYNMLTLNNVATRAGMLGISGGGGGDGVLYLRAPTSGGFNFLVNNTSIGTGNANGLSIVGGIQATGTYNVKNYGATGDGATNDTAAIVAAIAAIPAAGGVLYFPTGTYVTDTIAFVSKSLVTVKGDGRYATVIKNRTGGNVMYFRPSCSSITIQDLTADNNNSSRSAGAHGIVIGCSKVTVDNVAVTRCGEFAILTGWDQFAGATASVTDIILSNIWVYNTYADGVHFWNTTRGTLTNSILTSDDDCIAIEASYHITVSNCVASSRNDLGTNWGRGVAVFNGSTDVIVSGVEISGTKHAGIRTEGTSVSRVLFDNCTVIGCGLTADGNINIVSGDSITFQGGASRNAVNGNHFIAQSATGLIVNGMEFSSTIDAYARGFTTGDTTGSETINGLQITNCVFNFPLANQNEALYITKGGATSGAYYSNVILTGNTGIGNASDYFIFTANMDSTSKVYNNTMMSYASAYFHSNTHGGSTPGNANNN